MTRTLRAVLDWHRPLVLFSAGLAGLAVLCAAGMAVDERLLDGSSVWLKPFKFALSFMIYALTLAWLLPMLRRTPVLARQVGTVIASLSTIGVGLITFQAARGRHSHFNVSTPQDASIFGIMGMLVTLLAVVTMVVAVMALGQPGRDRVTTAALRFGLLVCVLGMMVAYYMVGGTGRAEAAAAGTFAGGAHSVGVADGGPGMPITGWSTTGGDMRAPHAVGLHALQVMPLLALLLTAAARRLPALDAERVRLGLVWVAGLGYAGLVVLLTWQARRGQPLIYPDALTLTALGVLLGAVVVAAGAVIAFGRRQLPVRGPAVREGVS
ncbi:hypothetical protein [Streptosporangium carneum]|uniref:Uncharacterized protein n=1 Tax=Streptosporangium carneum TaxID=47481 RepID=A0A9W6MI19_9ACTN|nr:hypothetical protein [Streptosporangium carneum]GLK15459.1 hypothetical protein GCM10017600_88720 [Streptosporangium carneum]